MMPQKPPDKASSDSFLAPDRPRKVFSSVPRPDETQTALRLIVQAEKIPAGPTNSEKRILPMIP